MLDKLLNTYDVIRDKLRFEDPRDATWYGLYLLYIFTIIWVLIGIYQYDKDMLAIFFWPFY